MTTRDKIDDLEEKLFELEKKLESKEQETGDLANIASVITSLLDINSVLAVAMEIAVRQVAGEVGAILLVENGRPEVRVAWGVDASLLTSLQYKDSLDIIDYCLQCKQTILDNDWNWAINHQVSIRNFLSAPIFANERVVGLVLIFNKEDNGKFTEKDILILEMICRFTSVAIENARLVKESLEKQRIEQELALARQVQATFLPENTAIDGLAISALYIPARQVGGDYYDLIPLSNRKLFFLMGDVSDKGVPAALVMTSVYSIIRAYVTSDREVDVKGIMSRLNRILCRDIIKNHDMFITLFMAQIDLESGRMTYCNGGHPPPLYFEAASEKIHRLRHGGPLVGQLSSATYESRELAIGRNDRFFCYTDGLIEACNRSGELYGLSRLEALFREGINRDGQSFSRHVKETIDRFSEGRLADSTDDYTTLVIDVILPPESGGVYRWEYESRLENLEVMYRDLEPVFERHGVEEAVSRPFLVALSEAVTNAIIHAHQGNASKIIRLMVEVNDGEVVAEVTDEGPGLDSILPENLDPVGLPDAESGRGLGIIRRLSNEVTFARSAQGGAIVRIRKCR